MWDCLPTVIYQGAPISCCIPDTCLKSRSIFAKLKENTDIQVKSVFEKDYISMFVVYTIIHIQTLKIFFLHILCNIMYMCNRVKLPRKR